MLQKILKSKTMWFNFLSIVLEIGTNLSATLPPGTALLIVNGINMLLRIVTKSSFFDE